MNLRSIILARYMLSILAILLLMDISTACGATESDQPVATKKPEPADMIIAVVNSIPLTKRDVDTRGKLFALSTGLPVSQEIMNRLRPQIIRQLIDERLRTQEILERHINVTPQQIAAAISNIERRNNLPKGSLIDHFKQDDLALTTLIDQLRVQIGWMQVLKQELGPRSRVSSIDIAQRQAALKREAGHPEYQISEIFIKVRDPRKDKNELALVQTIIDQLRKGAPFPIVAAQFSQSQTALNGGSMGWVQEDELDPSVIKIVRSMPVGVGAISNPIKVPGGFLIITLNGKRIIGKEIGHLISIRQVFLPFSTPLDPRHVTPQQEATLQKAMHVMQTAHSCPDMEKLNKEEGEKRPTNPGELVLERLNPQMQAILTNLPIGQVSKPVVSHEGIALLMVCSKQQKNFSTRSASEIADQLMEERIEQVSRQLDSDLHRRAMIETRIKSYAY